MKAIAAAAAAAGIGSLCLFGAFLWAGGLNLVSLGMAWRAALGWDTLLSFAFFVQHSGMVRSSFRKRLARRIGERWHGVVYTVVSAAVLTGVVALWQASGIELARAGGVGRWAIRAVFLLALAGEVWGAKSLGDFDLFGVRALAGPRRREADLVERGPYRWVRHPLYTCAIAMIWACPDLSADKLLFNVLWTGWIVAGAELEERDLEEEYGAAYRAYRGRVKRRLW